MAEKTEKEESPAKPKSWYKAILGTIGGLLSGAVMMYITPLVDKVVKPPKPVANFSVQDEGLLARFKNLSNYGEGNWDFGDGSPLVPTSAQDSGGFVEHTYPRPGDYTVKLSLKNHLGDENERSVPVHVEVAAGPAPTAPKIVSFEALPVSAGSYAPATFRVVSKVENAQVTVLDCGDERPLQVVADQVGSQEQLVTFQKPGGYVIKLAAVNGAKYTQKTEIITVMDAPANSLTALLTVTDEAQRLETKTHPSFFHAAFPADSQAATYAFQAEVRAWPKWTLADLAFKTQDGQEVRLGTQATMGLDAAALGLTGVRNLRLQLSDNKVSALLTGELVADRKSKNAPLPALMLPVTLSVEKKAPVTQTAPVTTTLTVPTAGAFTSGTLLLPPVPKDWTDCRRTLHLQVLNNGIKIYEDAQIQRSALVSLPNRKLILTTSQTNDQVRIDLMDAPTGVALTPQ